jgi:hypothetical protein
MSDLSSGGTGKWVKDKWRNKKSSHPKHPPGTDATKTPS